MATVGALPGRAGLGNGSRGLQRRRRRRGSTFPHDHARSRAYRWNEDGLAGISDDHQRLCLALAFWNGHDPILKERIFGLTGNEGNHGEDAKELLVVPGLDPDALVDALALPLPAGRVPLRAARRREPNVAADTTPSSSCSTPASSTTTATGTSPSTTPRPRPTTLHPGAGPQRRARRRPPSTCCRPCGSATPGRGVSTPASPASSTRTAPSWPSTTTSGGVVLVGDGRPDAPVLRQRDQRRPAVGRRRRRLPEGRHRRPRRPRRRHRQSRAGRNEGRPLVPARRAGRARPSRCGCASPTPMATAPGRRRGHAWPIASARPTSSTPR